MATIETLENLPRDEQGKLTPFGQAERWGLEFNAARERLKKWHSQGEKIIDRFLDERDAQSVGESRLNLFSSNVDTQHAMLYGQVPKVTVSRRFGDSSDDVARVAGEMLERLINSHVERDGSSFASAIGYALEDRLLPGFGFATARYEVETEEVPETPAINHPETGEELAPAVPATERKTYEGTETDWHYWKSVLWSPCRTWEETRWVAWCSPITRDALVERFGDIGQSVPLNTKTGKKGDADAVKADPWSRADVWEIWSKEDKTVYWYVEGFDRVLDEKPDPLGLQDFYPCPKPLIARPTTRSFLPRPDFLLAQDLYNEVDTLTTRINLLEKAIRISGTFDKNSPEVAKILSEAGFNKLYPSDNWAALAEKGGLKGVVDWFPLEQVVAAIGVLTEKRAEKIGLLQQVTGWSDIMRGQSNPNETLGAQRLKTRFGGVRVEKFQRELADFAGGLAKIQGEIIARHYDPETIVQRSNILNTPDAKHAQAAVQLIKDKFAEFRIEVKPESISLTDFAQMKEERVEVVGALAQLFSAAAPVVQAAGPGAVQFFLELGKWVIAGTKGSSEMEGMFDTFAEKSQQQAMQPKPPDPKMQQMQMKAQVDQAKAKMDLQATQAQTQAKVIGAQADIAKTKAQIALEQQRNVIGPDGLPMPRPMPGPGGGMMP